MKARGRGAREVPAPACQRQPPSWAQGDRVSVGRRETGIVAARTGQAVQTRSRASKGGRRAVKEHGHSCCSCKMFEGWVGAGERGTQGNKSQNA